MRKLLTMFIALTGVLFFSCQKEEVVSYQNVELGNKVVLPPGWGTEWTGTEFPVIEWPAPAKDKYNSSFNLDKLADIPVNIRLCYDTPNSYVATSNTYGQILSYNRDTGTFRERFVVKKDDLTGRHNIYNIGGLKSQFSGNHFSCWEQYPKERRYYPAVYHTTGSPTVGGKMYIESIPETENCYLAIEPTKGSRAGETLYMTQNLTDKKWVALLPYKAITGNNIFLISPVEEFDIIGIDYELGGLDNIELENIYVRSFLNYNSPTASNFSNTISETVTEKSTFSNTTSVSYSIKVSVDVSILSFNAATEMTRSGSWAFSKGEEVTKSKTVSDTYSFVIPAHTNMFLRIYVANYNISANYVAKLRGKQTGKITYMKGLWKGVQAHSIVYELNKSSGEILSVPYHYNLSDLKAEALAKSIPLIIK